MAYKILIIEDHEATAKMIAEVLTIEGFIPVVVGDGQTGLGKALLEKPALVLLDLLLPGISGLEVCKQLKGNPVTANIPVIMVSVKGSVEAKRGGLAAGCADYIVKPFEIEELIERVRKCLIL